MATAAERLKAALAKYANNSPQQSLQQGVRSNDATVPTASNSRGPERDGTADSIQGMERAVVGTRVGDESLVVSQSIPVEKQGALNDTPETPQTPAPEAPRDSVRTEGTVTTPEVLAPEVSVTTDVQSTDVVVVERPTDESVSIEGSIQGNEPETDLDRTNPVHFAFLQRLADVEAALLARDPLMKTHLGAIHKSLIQYEEIVNLLKPHEIAKIMAAQQAHTGIQLRAETLGKSKAAATKKAARIDVGDL